MKPCLLYADDALLFIKPEVRSVQMLKIAFIAFQQISGLAINLQKSSLYMVKEQGTTGTQLAAVMGCLLGNFPMTYLGLPLSDKRLNKSAYLPLIQKFNRRLEGWAAKHLSIAGRLVLLNAVLSSIPVYFMSCFKLPVWVIEEIDKIRRNFLWHGASQQKKIHLANWELVCTPKKMGGLGVMNLTMFNEALILKWFWKWTKPQNTLLKPILSHMGTTQALLPNTTLFTCSEATKRFWSISITRIGGNGDSISFWHHNWGIGLLTNKFSDLHTHAVDDSITLATAMTIIPLQEMFRQPLSETADNQLGTLLTLIAQSNPINGAREDEVVWRWQANGAFTVKSAYVAMQNSPRITSDIHLVWKLKAPPRFRVFAWLMALNKILTIDNLCKRGWSMANRCVMCKSEVETVSHLFVLCPVMQQLAAEVARVFQIRQPGINTTTHSILDVRYTTKERSIYLISAFIMWRERCTRIFRNTDSTVAQLLAQIEEQWTYTAH